MQTYIERIAFNFSCFVLGLIFIWFGALKLAGVSPVVAVIEQAFPVIVRVPLLYTMLGIFEVLVGVGILVPRITRPVAWLIVGHLTVATFSVLFSAQSFDGGFPVLSVVGEFAVKNFALIALALLLIIWPRHQQKT